MKILAVDDNEINRKLLRVVLESEGYEVVEASDGRKALQLLERENVDLIISDILMPNMDGYLLCYEVRRNERWSTVPFIVYTSTFDTTKDEKLALGFGVNRFVRRPAAAAEILKAIREVTAEAASQRPASQQSPQETDAMKQYGEQLVRKVEEKDLDLRRAHAKILEIHEALLTRTEQLEASEEKFRGIFENILDVVYRTDLEGKIRLISPSIRRYGYDPDGLIGANIKELYADPADRDKLFDALSAKDAVEDREVTLKRKEGETFVASLNVRLQTDPRDRPIGTEGSFRDITERKRLEAQFLQAQKMEGIGRLAGGIAHDFNNLLTVILGFTELVAEHPALDDAARGYLLNVQQATAQAANLTRQLLAFARKQVVEPKIIDLNNLLTGTGDLLRRLIGEDIQLVTRPRKDAGLVKVDLGQVEQLLVNLAVNARDAMPDGGKLTIETANVALDEEYARQHVGVEPGDYVMLAVTDTGHGIPEEVKAHIFEPFFTTKEQGKGTGLGLATCYGIVRQSGGHIWFYSEPGQGTTFKVYLPRVHEPAHTVAVRDRGTALPRGQETVLVVEDEPLVRAVAGNALRAQGYTVLEAADGEEALRVAQEYAGEIHLLMTDVVMPAMGGKMLAERLSQVRPGMKILYTSGYTDDTIVHHGVLDSGLAFLQKPYTPASLARKVREILDAANPV